MNTNIKVTMSSKFGVERCYPACETSRLLAELAGSITFSQGDVEILKQLGYEFEVIPVPSNFKFARD